MKFLLLNLRYGCRFALGFGASSTCSSSLFFEFNEPELFSSRSRFTNLNLTELPCSYNLLLFGLLFRGVVADDTLNAAGVVALALSGENYTFLTRDGLACVINGLLSNCNRMLIGF